MTCDYSERVEDVSIVGSVYTSPWYPESGCRRDLAKCYLHTAMSDSLQCLCWNACPLLLARADQGDPNAATGASVVSLFRRHGREWEFPGRSFLLRLGSRGAASIRMEMRLAAKQGRVSTKDLIQSTSFTNTHQQLSIDSRVNTPTLNPPPIALLQLHQPQHCDSRSHQARDLKLPCKQASKQSPRSTSSKASSYTSVASGSGHSLV
jgi:hypothetical protein